jgi:hypothetical protein
MARLTLEHRRSSSVDPGGTDAVDVTRLAVDVPDTATAGDAGAVQMSDGRFAVVVLLSAISAGVPTDVESVDSRAVMASIRAVVKEIRGE